MRGQSLSLPSAVALMALLGLLAPGTTGEWTQYGGNPYDTDSTTVVGPKLINSVMWTYPTAGQIIAAPVVGPDGTQYIGDTAGFVYAVSSTGTSLWSVSISTAPIIAPAALDTTNGVLIVGPTDGSVSALDLTNGGTLWTLPSGTVNSYAAPVFAPNGNLYFFDSNGYNLLIYDATGAQLNSVNLPDFPPNQGSPQFDSQSNIYFGSGNGGTYSLDQNGNYRWANSGNSAVVAALIVSESTSQVIIMDEGAYAVAYSFSGTKNSHNSVCNDVLNNNQQYLHSLIGQENSALYEAGGLYFMNCFKAAVIAMDITNNLQTIWVTVEIAAETGIAVGGDGTVYVGGPLNTMFALSPVDGSIIGSFVQGPAAFSYFGTPVIGAGALYFGAADPSGNAGLLYAIGDATPSPLPTPGGPPEAPGAWVENGGGSGATDYTTEVGPSALTYVQWQKTCGGAITAPPSIDGVGNAYFGCGDNKVYKYSPKGRLLWSRSVGGVVYSTPALNLNLGLLFFVAGDGYLYAFTFSGNLMWSLQVQIDCSPSYYEPTGDVRGGCSSPVIGNGNTVYVGSFDPNTLYAVDPLLGRIIWQLPGNSYFKLRASPTVDEHGNLYVAFDGSPGTVVSIAPNGIQRWSFEDPHNHYFLLAPVVVGNVVYAGDGWGHLYALDATTGAHLYTNDDCYNYQGSGYTSPYQMAVDPVRGYLYAACSNIAVIVTDLSLNSVSSLNYAVSSAITVDGSGTVYFGDNSGFLYAFPSASTWGSGNPTATGFANYGSQTTGISIGANGLGYIGTANGLFYCLSDTAPSPTASATASATPTATPTPTPTPSNTPLSSSSSSASNTPSPTPSGTPTPSPTPTASPSATATNPLGLVGPAASTDGASNPAASTDAASNPSGSSASGTVAGANAAGSSPAATSASASNNLPLIAGAVVGAAVLIAALVAAAVYSRKSRSTSLPSGVPPAVPADATIVDAGVQYTDAQAI